MGSDNKNMPTGRLARLAKMSGLSTAISSSYMVQKVKGVFQDEEGRARSKMEAHVRNAERMVETMGNMKGAVMKLGQMLSLGDDAHVPKEFRDVISKLQASAPTLPFDQVYDAVVANLGGAQPDTVFAHIDAEPLAAASLAQAHRARLRTGEDVVIKIQYPGVADTVTSDLRNLKSMIETSGIVGKRFNLDETFLEVEEMLAVELDYVQEADSLEAFARIMANRPRVAIPRLYRQYCTPRMLVMEYMPGLSLEEWLAQGPSQAEKDQLGIDMVDNFFFSYFNHRMIHADPQLGNFRFREDGTIVMLDFGCVKVFDSSFVNGYSELIRATWRQDRPRLLRGLHQMGFIDAPEPSPLADYLERFANLMMKGFMRDEPSSFIGDEYPAAIKALSLDPILLQGVKFPRAIIYLDRVHMGNYFLMRRLGVRANFHQILRRNVDLEKA